MKINQDLRKALKVISIQRWRPQLAPK